MIHTTRRLLIALVAFSVVAVGCSSNSGDDTTTSSTTLAPITTISSTSSSTTTEPPSTSTTEPEVEVADSINGLPADEALIDRRVVAVKIDNHVKARPQSGLEVADAVFEVLVEGGITRFIALFHQSDLDYVGPNRSGRPTDSKIIASLAGAPFQISGAQGWVKNIFKADDINVVYDNGVTTYRMPHRSAPHNLFTSSLLLREYADEEGWPDENPGNLFTFGEPGPGDEPATDITMRFSGATPSRWEYEDGKYLRSHGDTPHEWVTDDGDSGRVAFDVLVAMMMEKYIARNPAGSGTSLPTVETVGTGVVHVFYGGEVVTGTWERESKTENFVLRTDDGEILVLPAGRLWVALVPDDQSVTWE